MARLVKHPAPETMKLHKWKPWKHRKEDSATEADLPNEINNNEKKKMKGSSGSYQRKDVKCMDKKGLMYTMRGGHPTVAPNVGTLTSNLKRALEKSNSHLNAGTVGTRPLNELLPIIKKYLQDVYAANAKDVNSQLESLYNDYRRQTWKRHAWDAKKAFDEEYRQLADSLLKVVEGTTGTRKKDTNKVVIGLGLGEFSSKNKLSSLHQSFRDYFISKTRSLGYIVVGVNEYNTSKKCPICEGFVGQANIRRLHYPTSETNVHGDAMAGHNSANIVRHHLVHQPRPLYLQPIDSQGRYP
ncbi:hypothetical protein BGZ50_009406 [Haplosporangium sp. Z 11]|nr:hypothetical protein BGZ50_009406 [Haplosporangium sp. Z 11]